MAVRTPFPEQDFATGELESSNVAIDATDNRIEISCGRDAFGALPDDQTVIRCEVWLSLDAGATWRMWCGFTTGGGDLTTTGGAQIGRSSLVTFLPGANDARRRVRARVSTSRALRTDVRFVTSDRGRIARGEPPASVALDVAADGTGTATTGFSVSVTVAANSGRLLVAHVGLNSFPADEISSGITSVTYNTTETLSLVSYDVHTASPNNTAVGTYARLAPTETTANVVLVLGETMDRVHMAVGAFYNVDQGTPYGTLVAKADGTTGVITGSCTGAADGMASGYAFISWDNSVTSITDGVGQTARVEEDAIGGFCSASMATIAGSGALSFAWTGVGINSGQWVTHCLPLNPAAAAAGAAGPVAKKSMHYRKLRVA